MSELKVTPLFASPLVTLTNIECPGEDSTSAREERADAHEIVFVRGGAFRLIDRRGHAIVDGRSAILFNRGDGYRVSHPISGGDRCLSLAIRPDALIEMLSTIDESATDKPDTPFQHGLVPLRVPHHLALYRLIVSVSGDRYGDILQIDEFALRLAAELLREPTTKYRPQHTNSGRAMSARREIVERAEVAINARFREKVSLADLASATFTSPYHLCRVFKAETGQTLHQAVERLRLLAALDRLAESRDPLADIALSAGFANHSHFTAAFRRHFGQTPAQLGRRADLHKLSKILTA
jgi:AraC-like DNA-binding protein